MGVNDLMKKIRDGENHCNTTLKRLIKDTPERIIVGIDMSITIIKMIKRNPNHIDQLFTEPKRPVHGLIDAICNALDPIYKNEGVLVCVFDGLPGSLKKNHAHLSRYGKNEEKRRELEELYKEDDFDSFDEELANAVKVAKLRKELVSFNRPDLLYDLKIELEKRFEGRIYCVGAPFEADHQLAALFHQKIIDLVWTNDNDLCCLGCDVILNLKSDGKCLHVKFDDLLKTRFPDKICKDNIKWSKELLSHVCCFSGCDFIERNPGNSMAKVPDFLKSITDTEGNLMDDVALYNAVKSRWLIPTNVSNEAKAKWTEGYKENHLKLWKYARNMFLFGPASIVTPNNSEISIREAFISGNYTTHLSAYSQRSIEWINSRSELLIGYDPARELRDAFANREDFTPSGDDDEVLNELLQKSFKLEVWCKNGEDIIPLPKLMDDNNRELFHGSILDFEKVPVRCHTKDTLSFWLSCRQIQAPTTMRDVINLVKFVDKQCPDLKPIFKELMRGSSGWISPEILKPNADCIEVRYKTRQDALETVREIFPNISDNFFTEIFHKRNGTRKRIHMHLEGGSFDINSLRVTHDLKSEMIQDAKLVVFTIGCAPSQKLKEKGKEKYYDLTLVIEVNDDLSFKKFHFHPLSRCGCPNGCIICAHLGAFLVLLLILKNFDVKIDKDSGPIEDSSSGSTPYSYEDIKKLLPTPVNEVSSKPLLASHAFLLNGSDKKKKQNNFNDRTKRRKEFAKELASNLLPGTLQTLATDIQVSSETSSIEEQARSQGIVLPEENEELLEYALEGILDATDTPTTPVIEIAYQWLLNLRENRTRTGQEMLRGEEIDKALEDEAQYRECKMYKAVMIERQERFLALTKKFNYSSIDSDDEDDTEGSDNDRG